MTKSTFYSCHDFGGPDSMHSLLVSAGMIPVNTPADADIIVFNGGADIGTEIYNETPVFREIPLHMSNRDKAEVGLFEEYLGQKHFLGICRGSQLLNCLNGGTLWQHVNNHTRDHVMVDILTGETYVTTSTHHQMMRPNLVDGRLIAAAREATVRHAMGVVETPEKAQFPDGMDPEIVHYPKTNTLCVQGHPEYVPGSKYANYVLGLMTEHLGARFAA